MTKEDLESSFIYDKLMGTVLSRKTGKPVGSIYPSGLVVKKRRDDKIVSLSLGKMCYFLHTGVQMVDTDMICYLDGDFHNLKPDNLELRKYIPPKETVKRLPIVVVDRNIIYNPNNGEFVVRRSPYQAVYRADTLEEARLVRNEWESDKTIHKWDKTVKKYSKYWIN